MTREQMIDEAVRPVIKSLLGVTSWLDTYGLSLTHDEMEMHVLGFKKYIAENFYRILMRENSR